MSTHPILRLSCSTALLIASMALSGPVAAERMATDTLTDSAALVDQDRAWRADIRASVSQFAHISADDDRRQRRPLSDTERMEMRRDIDEAIRKAYGNRQRNR
ncbi:hypothetical protein [Denitromonas iodatirespirans]|uniref:Uncharacterized protein n=1 Tax=Denitromonas iodatirespirans TaxID=2795389 RepID=A0A944H712_DENI1|nr:hypothetical protein [Denitromonas iodatirespirans]MBT0960714.1 hypothetical protein [Denitromonas iodatirespirans]